MKKFILAALVMSLALLAVSTPVMAAIEVEGDAYVGVYDKYLWRGFDLSGGKAVAQGGVDIVAGNFTLSYWTNVQLNNDAVSNDPEVEFKSGEATETDIVIDYTYELNEVVAVSVGDIYYMLDGMDDTHDLYFSVALSTILEPAFTVYYDWDEATDNALYYTASVGHSLELTDELSLSAGALVGYNDKSDYAVGDYSDWHNYELSLGADYAVTEQVSLSASFLFSEGISNVAREAIDSETVGGVSIAFVF